MEDEDAGSHQRWARERSRLLSAIADLESRLADAHSEISELNEKNVDYESHIQELSQNIEEMNHSIDSLSQKNYESATIIDDLTKKMENALLNGQTSPVDRISWYRGTFKSNAGINKAPSDPVNRQENYSAGMDLINAAKASNSVKSSTSTNKTSHDSGKIIRGSTHSPAKSVSTHTCSTNVNSKEVREAKFAIETKIYTAKSHKRKVVRKKPKMAVVPRSRNYNGFILPNGNINEQHSFPAVQNYTPETCDNNSVNSGSVSTNGKSLPWEKSNNTRPSVDFYLNLHKNQLIRPVVDSNDENIDPIIIAENFHDDLRIRELLTDINSNDYKNLTIHVPHRPSTSASSVNRIKKVQVPLGNLDAYGWGRPTSAYNSSKYENNQYNYYQVHSVNKHRSYQERPATSSNIQPPSATENPAFYYPSNNNSEFS